MLVSLISKSSKETLFHINVKQFLLVFILLQGLSIFSFSSFSQSGVHLVRGVVKDVEPEKLILNDGTEVPYGLLVWSTGVGPSPLVKSLDLPKSPGGR